MSFSSIVSTLGVEFISYICCCGLKTSHEICQEEGEVGRSIVEDEERRKKRVLGQKELQGTRIKIWKGNHLKTLASLKKPFNDSTRGNNRKGN